MKFCVSFFSIIVCLLSGYVGGFYLDKQMKATNIAFKYTAIPKKLKILLKFNRLGPCTVLLLGIIIELSGIFSASAILVSTLLMPMFQPLVSYVLFIIHCFVLLWCGLYSYAKYLVYRMKNRDKQRLLRLEMLKLLSSKRIVCSVEIIETPNTRSDGMYLVKYGTLLTKEVCAQATVRTNHTIGDRCYALYLNQYPHWFILPNDNNNIESL